MATTFIFIGVNPASSAALIPAITSSKSPPLVISLYLACLKESRLIFTRFSPAFFSSCAYLLSNIPVSYTHLRAHETRHDLVCRLLLEKKKNQKNKYAIKKLI